MYRATEIQLLLTFIRCSAKYDVDISTLLDSAGIDPAELNEADYLITTEQYTQFIRNLNSKVNPIFFCLDLASWITPAHMGLLGYTIMSSDSPHELISAWDNFSTELIGNALNTRTHEANRSLVIEYSEITTLGEVLPFTMLKTVASAKALTQFLYGRSELLQVHFTFAEPESQEADAIRFFFNAPVKFKADFNGLEYESSMLDMEVLTSNREMHPKFLKMCEEEIGRLRRTRSFSDSVKEILIKSSVQELPSLDEIASTLCLSGRTVRRRLAAEGMSFQYLINDYRMQSAKSLLNGGISIGEVSYNLGFLNINSFRRAFKKWTGMTPGYYVKHADEIMRDS